MERFQEQIKKLVNLVGLNDASVDVDEEAKKIKIFTNEGEYFEKQLPRLITDFEHLIRLIGKKNDVGLFYIDINNYRKERERIITDLARAAARKVLIHKEQIKLPAMNAYERRLIHLELSTHPEVTTESMGEGPGRGVIVKPLS
ncbi:MAG: hypothetical protein COU08_00980 [Candidatus Harrisonbacteria bacterium CG10_big_fil_rev_8_21_14_0_10_42_17]|uniref:R3H domain-containing protein n=1 Tax=Candidatus Harrisonbacteria bacterium CG10_big_fil_rev_8_21_14_0_10_42_17 TaxID=1974584 RepID=A0A2M6WIV0_9BACT|nr:MAG: hypothetical protein COU08_00980 [Candidatus Harrisonbacteria bacterium CG10_big_fil_rev_8_21_14_0_10_42_17]